MSATEKSTTYAARADYQHNAQYLASKALSDWSLIEGVVRGDVLNVGCAEPIDELQWADQADSWLAMDANQAIIDMASMRFCQHASAELARKVRFAKHSVTAAWQANPLGTQQFDLVLSFSTVEHIPDRYDRQLALARLYRWTKEYGYCAITVPNRWNWRYRRLSTEGQKAGTMDFVYEYLYSPLELKRDLERVGFHIERFRSDYRLTPWNGAYGYGLPDGWSQKWAEFKMLFGPRMGYLCRRT